MFPRIIEKMLLPVAGLRGALWLCFGIGVCVFVAAMLLRQPAAAALDPRDRRKPLGREIHVLLAASFASGAVFFALEVIWTHLIAVVIGCSVYAFAWMLAAVLLGLMLGGFLVNRSAGKRPAVSPALLFQCSALLLLFQLALWNWAPAFFGRPPPSRFQNSFYYAEVFKLYVTFVLLVPASTILGLIYPTLLASPQLKREGNSYLAGYISAANSLGCLAGAWLAIFILLPRLGSEFSLKCVIAVLAAFWLAFLAREPRSRARLASAAVTVLLIAGGLAFYRWDWTRLTAGLGNYFGAAPVLAKAPDDGVQMSPVAMIFRHEDSQGGVTTVLQRTITARQSSRTIRTMMTNGKFQGDDNPDGQVSAQFGFAAIPSLFTRQLGRALLIGLGTGHSATTLRRVGYREIDIAEFSTGIVQAARQCFVSLNQGILSDPRVMLHIEDGRNVLLTDRRRQYDLITIEITSVWFAGSTNLYSQEFYELARQRLKPGGVLQQWVQLHHIGAREIACDLATARSVFPYVGLWFYGGAGMMIASEQPLELNPHTTERFLATGLSPEDTRRLVASLRGARLVRPDRVDALIREIHAPINTDHNRWIEYATPRYQSSSFDWMTDNLKVLAKYR